MTGVAGRFHVDFFADFLSDLTVVFWGCLYFSWDDGFLGGGKVVWYPWAAVVFTRLAL